jgi:hypothetical protein
MRPSPCTTYAWLLTSTTYLETQSRRNQNRRSFPDASASGKVRPDLDSLDASALERSDASALEPPERSSERPRRSRERPRGSRERPRGSRERPRRYRERPGRSRERLGRSRESPEQSRERPGSSRSGASWIVSGASRTLLAKSPRPARRPDASALERPNQGLTLCCPTLLLWKEPLGLEAVPKQKKWARRLCFLATASLLLLIWDPRYCITKWPVLLAAVQVQKQSCGRCGFGVGVVDRASTGRIKCLLGLPETLLWIL